MFFMCFDHWFWSFVDKIVKRRLMCIGGVFVGFLLFDFEELGFEGLFH
jgi:hypothetical protein